MAITIDGTNGLTTDNGALKLDGTTLVVDDTNNRVGIGTASPASTLHVTGSQLRLQTDNCSHQFYNTAGSRYAYLEAQSSNLILDVESGGGGTFVVKTSGSERIRVNQYGLLFNGDTAAANALDDYEEGTWDVTVTGSTSGEASYVTRVARYTKIGRQVSVVGFIQINKNTLSGTLRYSLPFAVANVSNGYTGININYWDDLATNVVGMWAYASSNQTYFDIRYNTAAAGNTNTQLTDTNINNGHELMFVGTYFTS